MSLPVKVNIRKLLNPDTVPYTIKDIKEVALGANMPENKVMLSKISFAPNIVLIIIVYIYSYMWIYFDMMFLIL